MKTSILASLIMVTVIISGCASTTAVSSDSTTHDMPQGYSGHGGMTAYDIKPDVYAYHFDNGFTGVDSMGWDANLQYAWSRAGGALTCDIAFDNNKVIENLVAEYGHDELIHDMNGIMFHNLQSESISNFCTPARVTEIKTVIEKLENNDIPKPF